MFGSELKEKRIFPNDHRGKKQLKSFLKTQNIRLDEYADYIIAIFDQDEIIATGSLFKNTLRSIAVKEEYQGTNVLNKIISHLTNEAYQRGMTHLFIYTKPTAAKSFTFLGFYEIARVDEVVLMENIPNGIQNYVKDLAHTKVEGKKIASIVMNANPFTKGHQYLVECAAKENDFVHVFAVSEEASIIPFDIRYKLIKEGTKHLKNVRVHDGGKYMVSSVTFPSYFMIDPNQSTRVYAKLDLTIFKKYIVPTLNINGRYVGEEPYCPVTNTYNEMMKKVLQSDDMNVKIIKRKEQDQQVISASLVRKFIKEGKIEALKNLVPQTTYEFFTSNEAKNLIEKIKNHAGRH